MAKIRFILSYTEEEWKEISAAAKGKKIIHLLYAEVQKKFGLGLDIPPCEEEVPSNKINRTFEIDVSDKALRIIKCQSKRKGIHPGKFISKTIIDPLLAKEKQ